MRPGLIGGVWLIITGLGLFASPAGAQSIYLHSPAEQEATANLATSVEAARAAHLAALDRHDADLNAAMQREQAAVIRRLLSRRDGVLAREIAGDAKTLDAVLTARLASIGSGTSLAPARPGFGTPIDPRVEARFESDLRQLRLTRLEVDRRSGEFRRASALALLRGGAAVTCDEKRPPAAGEVDTGDPVLDPCLDARRGYQQLIEAVPCGIDEISRTLLAVVARVKACWTGTTAQPITIGGDIGEAMDQVAQLGDAAARQQQAVGIVAAELKTLESYIACEKERAAAPDATARIAAAAAQIDEFLKAVAANDTGALSAATHAGDASPSACKTQAGETVQPASLSTVLATLRTILDTASQFHASRGIGAAAAEAAQDFRADRLGELLQAVATPTKPPEGRAATIVAALVRSAGPLETLAQVRAGTLPETSGVLVALAEARMRAATAKIEAERLQRLKALAEQKVAALAGEGILVRQSLVALRGASPNPERAIVLYATSVERGRVPAEVIDLRMDNIEFETWSRRERAAVEAGYAALTPATAELKAYGEGGIRADTIARFLNVAGLAAIAGTN